MSTKTDNENTSPDTENRNMSPDTENRNMSPDTENRNMSPETENRNMSPDTENRNMSPDTEKRSMPADTRPGSSSAGTETDHLFPETESKDASRETTIDNPSIDTDSTDTPDTLTLARLDRENQGTWEAEYSYGGEADLHRHYDICTKNPGHKNFIPVDKFSIEDLPEGYRDKDIMDYIRAVSDLTVRVTSKYVSANRPETIGVSGKPFPGYSYRGQRRTTVGTGRVNSVHMPHENVYETCRCKDCLTSSKPQTEFGIINICTARHVVYDESEAEHTTCHLYFDRGGTPETCEGVVALTGMSKVFDYQEIDGYWMRHYTHDLDLAHRLDQICKQRGDLQTKIWEKLPYNWNLKWSRPALDKQPLLFIVSHPHGCSKQISIGRCHSMFLLTDELCGYTYTTATCPGSSGARVYVLHKCMQEDLVKYLSEFPPVHHGVYDRQLQMNLSLLDEGLPVPTRVSLNLYEEGSWKDICYVEAEDLRKHYETCQNNPGHQDFFPVDKFSVDHLPPCKCKNEIMELIKVLSELTVRVSVRYVSEKRPETVRGTDIPYPWSRNRGSNALYPWYSYRGSKQLRVGSGKIGVVVFPDNGVCECEECKTTDTQAERKFARIHILTASHLVYDDLEGEHTTCHLFFDSGETPDACKDVVTLTNAGRTKTDIDDDCCWLVYCTHDLGLAHKLVRSLLLYEDLKRQCYSSYKHEIVKQNDKNNLTSNPPLSIVVSHPHGCAKHVSISYPSCHGNTDTEEIQGPYKSITCPGSSGAPVIAQGPQTLYLCLE